MHRPSQRVNRLVERRVYANVRLQLGLFGPVGAVRDPDGAGLGLVRDQSFETRVPEQDRAPLCGPLIRGTLFCGPGLEIGSDQRPPNHTSVSRLPSDIVLGGLGPGSLMRDFDIHALSPLGLLVLYFSPILLLSGFVRRVLAGLAVLVIIIYAIALFAWVTYVSLRALIGGIFG